jgi:hypothetical protein
MTMVEQEMDVFNALRSNENVREFAEKATTLDQKIASLNERLGLKDGDKITRVTRQRTSDTTDKLYNVDCLQIPLQTQEALALYIDDHLTGYVARDDDNNLIVPAHLAIGVRDITMQDATKQHLIIGSQSL